ncbi:hypothetical protein [Alloactinosynnema sp. L-07]|uniref:hypothetical protein n=1 Tax=Alloactinosynnema sp. L-07 TaxID=1653480 RepID=UPI00065F011B|nr:hypothetical protein [Alloactinosynnema sp. L-07]CRK58760.1 hypothetical protein [Alloactinosynnema sp. L-07]
MPEVSANFGALDASAAKAGSTAGQNADVAQTQFTFAQDAATSFFTDSAGGIMEATESAAKKFFDEFDQTVAAQGKAVTNAREIYETTLAQAKSRIGSLL